MIQKINPNEALCGYVRWSDETRNKKIGRLLEDKTGSAQGPRQFIYSYSQCHLLAFQHFRMSRMKAQVGDMLLPPVNRDLLSVARADLPWLKSVKGKVTWSGIFRAWLKNLLFDSNYNQEKITIMITEDALWQLYRYEPPLLLSTRRGGIIVAPLPDKQFSEFLPAYLRFNASEAGKKRGLKLTGTKRKSILFKTKPAEEVAVPMNETVKEILQRRLAKRTSELVFPSPKSGERGFSVKTAIKGAVKRSKVSRITVHDLRRTAASRLLDAGANHITIASILGHTNLRMIQRYAQSDKAKREAVELLNEQNRAKTGK